MSKTAQELATIFDFDYPNDDISQLAPPSYLDIPNGILKKPHVIKYQLIHPCENELRVIHTCGKGEVKPK